MRQADVEFTVRTDLALEEKVSAKPLWLPAIPAHIYVDALERKYGVTSAGVVLEPIIGEYDDPFNQRQGVLTLPLTEEGNCLIYGSVGSGKTVHAGLRLGDAAGL